MKFLKESRVEKEIIELEYPKIHVEVTRGDNYVDSIPVYDYVYEIDKNKVIAAIYDIMDTKRDIRLRHFEDAEDGIEFIENNFDELFDEFKEDILDYFKDSATEDANYNIDPQDLLNEALDTEIEEDSTEESIKSIIDDMLNKLVNYVKVSGKPLEDIITEIKSTISIPQNIPKEDMSDTTELEDEIKEPFDASTFSTSDELDIEPISYADIELEDDFDFALDTPKFDEIKVIEPEKGHKEILQVNLEDDEPVIDYVNENVTVTATESKPINLEEIK